MGLTSAATTSSAIEPGIEIANALLAALVTGIAATGEDGALPSGMLMGVGSILLIGLNLATKTEGPPPPDISSIQAAVQEVIL